MNTNGLGKMVRVDYSAVIAAYGSYKTKDYCNSYIGMGEQISQLMSKMCVVLTSCMKAFTQRVWDSKEDIYFNYADLPFSSKYKILEGNKG